MRTRLIVGLVVLCVLLVSCARPQPSPLDATEITTYYPIVDVHTHPVGSSSEGGPSFCTHEDNCIDDVLSEMDADHVLVTLTMSPPRNWGSSDEIYQEWEDQIKASAALGGEKFRYAGGGASLNAMIQEADDTGVVSVEIEEAFEQTAREMAESGAVAYGELAILHMTPDVSQFQSVPSAGGNRLLQILVDVAAEYEMPIDIHLEAVEEQAEVPQQLQALDSEYEDIVLEPNIAGFEDLLDYNMNTKIVWAHAGWDSTGQRTFELTRTLLERHPNLYIHLQLVGSMHPENNVVDEQWVVREEWVDLFESYPDRFMIGTDRFFVLPDFGGAPVFYTSYEQAQVFLNQLPDHLALKIGCQNAVNVYNLALLCE